jgi:hypothetical protein
VAESSQQNFDFFLVLEAGMVGTDGDLHGRKDRARQFRLSRECRSKLRT